MGAARTVTIADWMTQVNFELRNIAKVQYTEIEMLGYLNKWLEFIWQTLIEAKSELARTGSGAITTVAATETYSFAANDMGDFLTPHKIWITGEEPLEQCTEEDRYPYLLNTESGNANNDKPTKFYIEGDNIGLLPFPDDVYTVNVKYYPESTYFTATTETLPLRYLFNLKFQEGAIILAKNSENYGTAVDSGLMELFRDRCLSLLYQREQKQVAFTPVIQGD